MNIVVGPRGEPPRKERRGKERKRTHKNKHTRKHTQGLAIYIYIYTHAYVHGFASGEASEGTKRKRKGKSVEGAPTLVRPHQKIATLATIRVIFNSLFDHNFVKCLQNIE